VWPYFPTLPKAFAAIAIVGAAIFAWVKRKVVASSAAAATGFARDHFWSYVRKNVQSTTATAPSNQKAYKGLFLIYGTYQNYPHENFFELLQDGVTLKVPVWKTNFFTGIQHGTLVEVDTEVVPGARAELVRRVRVAGKK